MAQGIKKVVVPKSSLLQVDWNAEGYLVRYRIKTENKNLTSHWSPVYNIPLEPFEKVLGGLVETVGQEDEILVSAVWDDVLNFPLYDVFVAFRGGEYYGDEFEYDGDIFHYHGTTQNHNYSFVKIPGASNIRIVVQIASNIKRIKEPFIVFDYLDQIVASES